jgi:putative membrane protein
MKMNRTLPNPEKVKQFRKLIIALSIIIPIAVAFLFGIKIEGVDFSILPPIYAGINGLTAVVLIFALIAIKMRRLSLHQRLIQFALLLSLLFLVAYVLYHITSDSTSYGGDYKTLYLIILISHIVLSVLVIPIVLFTYLFAWQGNYKRHKKWTRFAFPIWLYVAITGVVVYLMISPFY